MVILSHGQGHMSLWRGKRLLSGITISLGLRLSFIPRSKLSASWRSSSDWTTITRVPAARAGQPWTESEVTKLQELRAAGRSQKDIARELGRSWDAIRRAPKEFKAPKKVFASWTAEEIARVKTLQAEGMKIASIATILERKPASIYAMLNRDRSRLSVRTNPSQAVGSERKPWTEGEEQRLLDLRQEGKTAQDMAQIVGRSASSVNARLNALKLGITRSRIQFMPHEDAKLAQLKAAGQTWKEIHASMPHRSAESLWARYQRNKARDSNTKFGVAWSQGERDKLHELLAKGMKRHDVARSLGRSLEAVDYVWKQSKNTP